MSTKAMVLAAGTGSRLMPLTESVPKPMLTIGGQPLLQHVIEYLRDSDIRHIVINLHHGADTITSHFGNGNQWDVEIRYSVEPVLLGTAGAVKKVGDFFEEPFLVIYGDNLTTCDLRRFEAFHKQNRGIATIAVFRRADVTQSGVVEFNDRNRVDAFIEKPQSGQTRSTWVNAGILMLEPEVLDLIPPDVPCDFGRDILPPLLTHSRGVFAYPMGDNEQLWWIDTPEEYRRVHATFSRKTNT